MLDQNFVDNTAREVESLAADARFAPRAHDLGLLATDVRNPKGDLFAGVDLFAAFPDTSVIQLDYHNVFERIVGVIAGISVFLPVAWTWWGFRDASAAYGELIKEEGEPEGTTFLALWTSGFDGRLATWHQLVPMALGSLLLILVAILAVVAHRLVAESNMRREDKAQSSSRNALASTLTHAQVVLNARRADHPERIETIVKSTLEKLEAAQHATFGVVANLEKSGDLVGKSLEGLVAVADSSRTEASELLSGVAEMASTLNEGTRETTEVLRSSVLELRTAVTGGMEQTERALTGSATALGQTIHQTTEQASASLSQVTTRLAGELRAVLTDFQGDFGQRISDFSERAVGEVNRASSSLHSVVDAIGSSADASTTAARDLSERVNEMTEDNAATREEMRASLEAMRETLLGIESALDRHESVLQGQTTELSGARDSAERLLRRLSIAGNGQLPGAN